MCAYVCLSNWKWFYSPITIFISLLLCRSHSLRSRGFYSKKTVRILSFVLLFTLLSFISQAFHSIHHRECLFRLQFMPFGRRFEIHVCGVCVRVYMYVYAGLIRTQTDPIQERKKEGEYVRRDSMGIKKVNPHFGIRLCIGYTHRGHSNMKHKTTQQRRISGKCREMLSENNI